MIKHWKKIIILIILLILGFIFYQNSFGKSKNTQNLKSFTVKRKDLQKTISSSGKVKADHEVELKFQTGGLLTWVGVKEGQEVKAWQAIAKLDSRELEKRLLKSLRDYSKERWDFEEDRKDSYQGKIITDTIKRILEKNQFDLDKAVADVEISDLALQFSTLITPIAGIVTKIDTPVSGVNITPASAVFTISDPDSLIFRAEIDETDISHIKEGQKVILIFDAYPQEETKGTIENIGFSSVSTSGGGNAYAVKIKLPENKNLKYKIGMNGDASIILAESKNTLTVPLNALTKQNGKSFVYLYQNKIKVKTEVVTGLTNEDEIEIKNGLKEGDKVIVNE